MLQALPRLRSASVAPPSLPFRGQALGTSMVAPQGGPRTLDLGVLLIPGTSPPHHLGHGKGGAQ